MRTIPIKTEHRDNAITVSWTINGEDKSATLQRILHGSKHVHRLALMYVLETQWWTPRVRFIRHATYFAPGNLHYHYARVDLPAEDTVLAVEDRHG